MILFYQRTSDRDRIPCIRFGVEQLREALAARGVRTAEERLRFYPPATGGGGPSNGGVSAGDGLSGGGLSADGSPVGSSTGSPSTGAVSAGEGSSTGGISCFVISLQKDGLLPGLGTLARESFVIRRTGGAVHIVGADDTGAMYGALDAAESVLLDGPDAVKDKHELPFLAKRGVKFNLPYQPYGPGEVFDKNKELCMTIDFWRDYIDFLAKNRYNCLSLWSMNPFEMMFRIEKYPGATPYTDAELRRFKEVYTFIFRHAQARGIETYLITWNLRITPHIAQGLGLPPEIAARTHDRKDIGIRQSLEVVKDYYREAIKTLLMTYPEMTGLGTTNSEELTGTVEERQQWVADTYLEAAAELNFPTPFIHRTNTSNGTVTQEIFLSRYNHPDKYISWKYSNAHMYSHPLPRFEELFNAWGSMNLEADGIKVIYTVRNDDFHNLRGCDPGFIARYIHGMKEGKNYVAGFYWGADGYVWAGETQHVSNKHQNWKYSFEKHWMQFEMLGRLGYNPNLDPTLWEKKFAHKYGAAAGVPLYRGLCAGVRILCAVNRLYWWHYDANWHPESMLSMGGVKTILEFIENDAMPLAGMVSIKEYAAGKRAGRIPPGENPEHILALIAAELDTIRRNADLVQAELDAGRDAEDLACAQLDLLAWHALGSYYRCKFDAAVKLAIYRGNGDEALKADALGALRLGLDFWKELSLIGAQHYLPYYMGRVQQTFGWSYYIDEIERDIFLASTVRPESAAEKY
ncbi:MAG: hypothetical protein LBU58_06680 [Clostridiales bacterium]|nr:hypothetical protein [Clostridiales bacterium]